ncbi:MAG TPA: rhodanese-like domain-containing protein [Desulfomonilaceae bacterium]|nr:rhodanese-like domain-containing protein [Desulfomonilaceae bacterium]
MKKFAGLIIRSLAIAVVFGAVGLSVNMLSSKALPLVYVPPPEMEISGVKVPLVNEHTARTYFDDGETSFLDTRKPEDYSESHVKGSLSLSPDDVTEAFPDVQPLLPLDNRIVLYCYGPECDMAERVAGFMISMGYKKLVIMSAGLRPWEAAGYPVDGSRARERHQKQGHGAHVQDRKPARGEN